MNKYVTFQSHRAHDNAAKLLGIKFDGHIYSFRHNAHFFTISPEDADKIKSMVGVKIVDKLPNPEKYQWMGPGLRDQQTESTMKLQSLYTEIINEVDGLNYFYIQHHPGSGGAPREVLKIKKFDKVLLQKTFDEFAKTMEVGDALEYGKADAKQYHPFMLHVEMTENGLIRWTDNGKKAKYRPQY